MRANYEYRTINVTVQPPAQRGCGWTTSVVTPGSCYAQIESCSGPKRRLQTAFEHLVEQLPINNIQLVFGNGHSDGTQLAFGNGHSDGTQLAFGNGHSDGAQLAFGNGHSDGTQLEVRH